MVGGGASFCVVINCYGIDFYDWFPNGIFLYKICRLQTNLISTGIVFKRYLLLEILKNHWQL